MLDNEQARKEKALTSIRKRFDEANTILKIPSRLQKDDVINFLIENSKPNQNIFLKNISPKQALVIGESKKLKNGISLIWDGKFFELDDSPSTIHVVRHDDCTPKEVKTSSSDKSNIVDIFLDMENDILKVNGVPIKLESLEQKILLEALFKRRSQSKKDPLDFDELYQDDREQGEKNINTYYNSANNLRKKISGATGIKDIYMTTRGNIYFNPKYTFKFES